MNNAWVTLTPKARAAAVEKYHRITHGVTLTPKARAAAVEK